jgi:hypothetical protein
MAMDEGVKVALLEAGEETTKTALEQSLKVAKAYVASTKDTSVDDSVVNGIQMLYDAFLADLADKINPHD